MASATNRDLRRRLYEAYTSRCMDGKYDNRQLSVDIVNLRLERARMLGYENYAAYTLETNMAGTPEKVRELLTSERGILHRSRRPIEPEAVFGQIKADRMFRRFRLRSLEKVNIEFGLVALAHNLRKMAANTPLSGPYNVALSQTGRCCSAKYPLPSIPKISAVRYIIGIHNKEAV